MINMTKVITWCGIFNLFLILNYIMYIFIHNDIREL
jgi:hypothetical protein